MKLLLLLFALSPAVALACRCAGDATKLLADAPEKAAVFMLGEVLGHTPPLTFRPTEVWRGDKKDITFGGGSSCDHRVAEKKKYVLIAKAPEGIFLCNSLLIPEAEAAFYVAKGRALVKGKPLPGYYRKDIPEVPVEWRRCATNNECRSFGLGCFQEAHINLAYEKNFWEFAGREVGPMHARYCEGLKSARSDYSRCENGLCVPANYPDKSSCEYYSHLREKGTTTTADASYFLAADGEAECLAECERQKKLFDREYSSYVRTAKCTFDGRALPMP